MDKIKHEQTKANHRAKKLYAKEQRLRDTWVTFLYGSIGHKACGRKQRYTSLADAQTKAIRNKLKKQDTAPSANATYPCPFCQGWHTTHVTTAPENGWTAYIQKAMLYRQKVIHLTPSEKMVPLTYDQTNIQKQTIGKLEREIPNYERSHLKGKPDLAQKQRKLQKQETLQEIQHTLTQRIKNKQETQRTTPVTKPPKKTKVSVRLLKQKKKGAHR